MHSEWYEVVCESKRVSCHAVYLVVYEIHILRNICDHIEARVKL
jgi:hypothetical protein